MSTPPFAATGPPSLQENNEEKIGSLTASVSNVSATPLSGMAGMPASLSRRSKQARFVGEFGRYGVRLYELTRGIDENPVLPDPPTRSISVEDTFEHDVPLSETEPMIRRLAEELWSASRKESRTARTVVLKLKTSEFRILTRSHTPSAPPSSCEELTEIAVKLRARVDLGPQQRYRLVGIGLSNFQDEEEAVAQPALFE